MSEPKEPKYEPEGQTLVVSNGVSGQPPPAEGNTAGLSSTSDEFNGPSDAPTLLDGEMPTLAATASPFLEGLTLPAGASPRFNAGPVNALGGTRLQRGAVFANRYEIIKTLG